MINIAKMDAENRKFLFNYTAGQMGINVAMIEKDFWVSYLLDYLFNKSKYSKVLTFKGGTSLSKGYNVIRRFSEDIDLILDWRVLKSAELSPIAERSNTQQDKLNKQLNKEAEVFICQELLEDIKINLEEMLEYEVDVRVDSADKHIINFYYPRTFKNDAILQYIRLEIGPLAAWTPSEKIEMSSYVAEFAGDVIKVKTFGVNTVKAERTFWEKATILHREANRPQSKNMPGRYSRHYYDLYMLGNSRVKGEATQSKELLARVVEFKNKFYKDSWAKYEECLNGNLKLVPPIFRMEELAKDYMGMKEMLYGEIPVFEDIVAYLNELEKELNLI